MIGLIRKPTKPIEEQDKVRQENQTEDTGKKKGEIRVTRQIQQKQDMYKMR